MAEAVQAGAPRKPPPADRPVCCWWCGYELDAAAMERAVRCPECAEVSGPPPAEAPLRPRPWPGRVRLVAWSVTAPAAVLAVLLVVPPHMPGAVLVGPLAVLLNAAVWPWTVVESRVALANRGRTAARLCALALLSGSVLVGAAAGAWALL